MFAASGNDLKRRSSIVEKRQRDGRWLARREPGRRRFGAELAQPADPKARLLVGASGGRREAEFEVVISYSDR